jgi:hypothetical protein
MLTRDERNVRERLEAWELRIQRILAIYDRDGKVPLSARSEVRSLYGSLKLGLKAAFKAGDCWGGLSQMNGAERRVYHPAIAAASALLLARAESGPDAWYRSLCGALSAISDTVVLLDERDGKAVRQEWSA